MTTIIKMKHSSWTKALGRHLESFQKSLLKSRQLSNVVSQRGADITYEVKLEVVHVFKTGPGVPLLN